jgi:shikimate dehydrogenase
MKKRLAVIGHPISHSLSPLMHNYEFQKLELPYEYEAIDVEESELKKVIDMFRSNNFTGCNVTIPYKEKVLPLLDEIDEEAKALGAVNTVVNRNGKLIGYNTDGQGYMNALAEICPKWYEKKILVIGAGGAARAIYVTLLRSGAASIDLTNRNVTKALKLKEDAKASNTNVLSISEAEKQLANYEIIINTTPVGMNDNFDVPLQLTNINKNTIVSDIIYTPMKTTWLQIGEQKGAKIINGLTMFVNQGALAFEHWTGITPNKERMKQVVYNKLKERNNQC